MIKLTYKSKNRTKTTEKQALPFAQPKTETLVETVLSASQASLAAGASALSGESGPPPHQKDNMGWSGWEEFRNLTPNDKTNLQ